MNLGIQGKRALIVGASKGIGKDIALSFAKENVKTTSIARSESLLKELNKEVKEIYPADHNYYVCDLMAADNAAFAQTLLQENEKFDIVIHNVGGSLVSRDYLGTIDEWNHALKFNAGIAIELNHYLLPSMIEKKWGRVIHISSISGVMLRGNPLYASAKAFLNAYITTVGRSIAKTGVVVSGVMPGAVAFQGSYWDEYMKTDIARCDDFLRHHQAIGRFGTTKEIADAVLFLASEQASFMPGSIMAVDGANM